MLRARDLVGMLTPLKLPVTSCRRRVTGTREARHTRLSPTRPWAVIGSPRDRATDRSRSHERRGGPRARAEPAGGTGHGTARRARLRRHRPRPQPVVRRRLRPPLAPHAYAGVGLFIAPILPTGLPWSHRAAPRARRAGAVVVAAATIGDAAAGPLLGKVIELSGIRAVSPVPAAVSAPCPAAALRLVRATGRRAPLSPAAAHPCVPDNRTPHLSHLSRLERNPPCPR